MLNITIRTIPHSAHRYETVGDWQVPEEGFGQTAIVVSDMGDTDMEFLVAFHELIEYWFCKKHGVSAKAVTKFDKEYETKRKKGDDSEPGDDRKAPYYRWHQLATGFERLLAALLGVDWNEYEKKIYSL